MAVTIKDRTTGRVYSSTGKTDEDKRKKTTPEESTQPVRTTASAPQPSQGARTVITDRSTGIAYSANGAAPLMQLAQETTNGNAPRDNHVVLHGIEAGTGRNATTEYQARQQASYYSPYQGEPAGVPAMLDELNMLRNERNNGSAAYASGDPDEAWAQWERQNQIDARIAEIEGELRELGVSQNEISNAGIGSGENSPTLWERIAKVFTGAEKQYFGAMADVPSVFVDSHGGTLANEIYEEQRADIEKRRDALLRAMAADPEYAKDSEAIWQLNQYNQQLGILDQSITANQQTGAAARDAAAQLTQSGAADVERASEGLGVVGKTLVNTGVAGVQMANDVALGAFLGAADVGTLPERMSTAKNIVPMLFRSFGGGTQEARGKGYNVNQQLALGLTNAAIEYFSEKLFGGNPLYDKADAGLVNQVIGTVLNKIDPNIASRVMSVLSSGAVEMLNEGWEEVVSDLLNPFMEKLITGKRDPIELEQIVEDWIVGVALGGMGTAAKAIGNAVSKEPTESKNAFITETEPQTVPPTNNRLYQAAQDMANEDVGLNQEAAETAEEFSPIEQNAQPAVTETAERSADELTAQEKADISSAVNDVIFTAYRNGIDLTQYREEVDGINIIDPDIEDVPDIVAALRPVAEQIGDPKLIDAVNALDAYWAQRMAPQAEPAQSTAANDGLWNLAEEMAAEEIAKTVPPAPEIAPVAAQAPQTPRETTPATKAPAAATVGTTATPEKKGGNFIARGEKNGLPFDIVVERIPSKETPTQAAPKQQTPQETIRATLMNGGRVTVNGMEYTLTKIAGPDGKGQFVGQIRNASDDALGGMIQNARNIYRGYSDTREGAISDMIAAAENGGLFGTAKPQGNVAPAAKTQYNNPVESTPKADATAKMTPKEGAENGERVEKVPDGSGASESPVSGARDGGLLDEVAAQDLRPDEEGRGESGGVLRPEGERVLGHADGSDAAGNERGRSLGNREGRNLPSAGEVTQEKSPSAKEMPAAEEAPAEEAGEKLTVEQQTEQEIKVKDEEAVQEKPRGENFVIPEKGLSLPSGEKAKYKSNIQAIKTLRTLMAEGRLATPEEQEILSKYVGWGGLANAFDEKKSDWTKEYKQIKALLSDEEYSAARGSTLNAHYTDVGVIRAMYAGLESLGFKGGRLLEPSAGVGHFAGAMPENLLPGVKSWTMVELDKLTGNIAKYLYPNADVRVQGFETAKIPDNYMDLVISNVPFGNYGIADKSYPKEVTGSIHNYFFAKSLDKVRPGGLVAFITSRYTMDSGNSAVRRYIMKRADLLGAIRLPDSAFKGNAGTEVVTDIIILKKRQPGTAYSGEAFENTDHYHRSLGIYETTNEYFHNHPEMVLGEASSTGGMHRSNSLTYTAKDTRLSLQKQIEKAFSKIEGKMDYPVRETPEEVRKKARAGEGRKNGNIVKRDGKLYRVNDGELEETAFSDKDAKRMEGVIGVRDAGRALLDAQISGMNATQIAIERKKLNALYDAFVKENGPLNKPANARLIKNDSDFPFILSLENYDKETKTATKAAIFTKNTVSPNVTVSHADTAEEALTVCMNETGEVDLKRIAELTGESEDAAKRVLLDGGLVFLDRDGNLETAEQYLSGNVKAKLRDAEALAEGNKEYQRNVDALKKIIPPNVAPEDIAVRLGVTWVPDTIYGDFAAEMLGSSNRGYRPSVTVQYSRQLGQFTVKINEAWLKNRPENLSTWGTVDKPFTKILEATLNNRNVTVWRKNADGSRILDKQATAAAQEKQEKVLAEFQKWIWSDEKRRTDLAKLYNDVFNNTVTPHYDGSNLTVDGANAEKPLRQHQKDAVQRIINSGGNTLLAHRVGAGKTYEMAAAAMKLRQLGIVKKPMFVVPKSLVAQWGNEFLDFFPAAKVLVTGEKDFSAANRKVFANRIATGDYDAVIMSYEQFKAVPMSYESQEAFYQQQIDELEEAIYEAAAKDGKRAPSVKQLEKSKKSLEAKLRKLGDMKKDADNIDFESLGVDSVFVDEAHNYKNLFYTTNMQNVSGLSGKNGSERAFDLYMKVRYLQKLNGGRGVVFATATPVMNSMAEMYIMQKFLQSDLLDARGLTSFDAWANQFGEVRTVLEMNPSGKGFRQKQSFSRFKNLAELQQMFRSFADVITEIPGLKIPEMKTGKRIIVESEPSEFQMQYIDELAKRADAIKSGSVDPSVDNMLKITSEGRKLSYTQRMIDPSLPYEEGNKIMKAAQNVADIYRETSDIKGTQLIFCDLSTPKGGAAVSETSETQVTEEAPDAESISIYDDIKNVLVGYGIPANEIAFIHDANTDEKKAKLFADVNEGKVRILIGSTGKMGVGMNAQKRMVALHHLDAPWRPGDIEQREGRALRQGNINDEVGVYVYVTKKTFDSRMWDNLQRKAGFIHQVMAGDLTARESEGDGDFALSAAEIKAISSGNPLIIEQFETAAEITKLESLERSHNKEVAEARKRLAQAKAQIVSDTDLVQRYQEDLATRQDTTGDKFSVTIGGKTYTDRKAAGEAIIAQAKKHLDIGNAEKLTPIGSFAGFELLASSNGDLVMRGAAQYRTSVNMQSAAGTVQSMEAMPKRIDSLLDTTQKRLAETESRIGKLEKIAASSFDRADELAENRRRMAEIMAELNPDEDTGANLGDEDEEDLSVAPEEPDKAMNVSRPQQWTAERVGSSDKKPMGLSEIIEKIRHDFGLNITTGHIRGSGVLGQYNPQDHGIRTKSEDDLATATHELGHYFERTYDITGNMPASAKSEIVNNLDPEFAANYPEKKLPREGVAEFLRRYLQNSETAAIDYPEFTKYFLNAISGPDEAKIMTLADEVNAYFALGGDTASDAVRRLEEGRPDVRTVGEKIKDKYHNFYQAWIDSNHGIKLFDRATGANTYKLATNAAYADARAGAAITGNLYDRNGAYVAPGLKSCFAGNEKYLTDTQLYDALGEYLVVKHGPERLAEGKDVFADPRKNRTAWMNKRAAELEAQHPELEEISERLYDFQKQFLQTWGVDTGLVSQKSADEWAERWQYYVPFNRVIPKDGGRIGAKRGFANQDSTIKMSRGSKKAIINPVDNIITNIVKMVNAGVRNGVMQKIAQSAAQMGDAAFLEQVPMPVKKKTYDARELKAELKSKVDASPITDAEEVYGIIEGIDDILEQYGRGKAYGDIVTVLVDGKPEYWKINDPLLLQSITNMAPKKMEGILDAYAQVSRFMTGNITGNNLLWSIFSNFPRDLGTFFVYSKEKNPVRVFASMGSAYVNKVKGDHADPLYMEYLAMGGGGISAYTADRDLAKRAREKLAGKKISANPLDWIAFTSDMIEMGPRYATYKLMRENGMTPQEAFYEAMDITVNFRRGGRLAREVNKVVPFFNAGVQGLDKFARYITAEDAPENSRNKVRRGRMAIFLAVSAALAAAFYFLNNRDDDSEKDYQQLSNYTKNSYWLFPMGDGKFFAIPKPRELAVLSSFFEACMEYGIGKNDHALDEFYDYVTDTSLPNVVADLAKGDWQGAIGSLGLIGVGAYLMANRDFLGKPIESAGMQYLEPKDRYNARTSKIAYAIGQAFNVSPQKVDYFFSQVLGGWWKAQKALFPVGSENVDYTLGVQNSYVKDNQYSTDIVNRLYDMAEKSAQAKNSAPGDIDKAIAAKRDDSMTTFYSRYNALSKNSSSTASRSTRQVVLDMILEYEKSAESGTYTEAEKAVLDVVRETGDTGAYMPSVMNTVVKDGNGVLHNLSDVQYVEYQTDYLRIYYELIEDAMPFAKSAAERAAIVKHAKDAAMSTATARTLGRIGAPQVKSKYEGVSDTDVVIFTGLLDIADDDGSLKQAEVIDAITQMQNRNGLSNEDANILFHSKYDSDKNNPWAK